MQLAEDFVDVLVHLRIVNERAFFRFISEGYILPDRQISDNQRLLMHLGNAALRDGLIRIPESDLLAVQKHIAVILRIHTVKDVEESGFSGTIFPKQCMHFPFLDRKGDILQDMRSGEILVDFYELYRFSHFCSLL